MNLPVATEQKNEESKGDTDELAAVSPIKQSSCTVCTMHYVDMETERSKQERQAESEPDEGIVDELNFGNGRLEYEFNQVGVSTDNNAETHATENGLTDKNAEKHSMGSI